MDELRVEIERLAAFALEEIGTEACHGAIRRALERVVARDGPQPPPLNAGDVLTAEASMWIDDDGRWSLDAFFAKSEREFSRWISARAVLRGDARGSDG